MLLHVLPLVFVAALQVKGQAGVEKRPVPDSTKAKAAADTTKRYERDVSFGISIGGSGSNDDEERAAPRRIPVTDEHSRTAFKDATARDLLLRARAARLKQDSLLVSYEARTYQRFSVGMGLRAFGRERVIMRHEDIANVRWHRTRGVWADVKGSRTALPVAPRDEASENVSMGNDPPIPYYPGRYSMTWMKTSS